MGASSGYHGRRVLVRPEGGRMTSPADNAATVRAGLELGLQVWRTTDLRVRFLDEFFPALAALLAQAEAGAVKFCPYCAGAFVPESPGYEGPCAGCKRAESFEADRDAAVREGEEYARERDKYAETIRAFWDKLAPGKTYDDLGGATLLDLLDAAVRERDQAQEALRSGVNYLNKISDPMCPPAIRQVALDHFDELARAALTGEGTE